MEDEYNGSEKGESEQNRHKRKMRLPKATKVIWSDSSGVQ